MSKIEVEHCPIPPEGWICTRKAGHSGPCAAIPARYTKVSAETPLNEELIKRLGFAFKDYGDDPPYEMWEKDQIKVWDMNGDYWLVNMLEQAGIDHEFHTLGELDLFFKGCGKPGFL